MLRWMLGTGRAKLETKAIHSSSENGNIPTDSSEGEIFEIDFAPEICFKNAREYPAVLGGSQFCGLGHFCEVVLFVNMSNVTNVTG